MSQVPNDEEIARIRKQVADARAMLEALQKKSDELLETADDRIENRKADAAEAAAQGSGDGETSEDGEESSEDDGPLAAAEGTPGTTHGPLDADGVAAIREGYATERDAIDIGALVNGAPDAETPIRIPLSALNRHGIVSGATGTGKTKTLQVLAEQISGHGVPVFAVDIKGDLSGIATAGEPSEKLLERTKSIGQNWQATAAPVEFFALGGKGVGIPLRTTVTSFGPLMLAKVLGLNKTQESSLGLVFHYADEAGLPLVDLGDVRSLLTFLTSPEGKTELASIGGLSKQTAGVILREITNFESAGADDFFGQPEFDTTDFLRTAADGRGIVSVLEVPGVADQPRLFSTFVMWLLADLFNDLPEVGDTDKPKLVFFFDEAHLLFRDASKAFLEAITQTVRLIRSKGVGIFFVTQTPKDVPDEVLEQLGSRIQHQMRVHTPEDEKALKATVRTFPKTTLDLAEVLTSLPTGDAVVTMMNEKGAPAPVAHARIRAPQSSMDPTPEPRMREMVAASGLLARYAERVDPHSATEMLAERMNAAAEQARREAEQAQWEKEQKLREKELERQRAEADREARAQQREWEREQRAPSRSRTKSRQDKTLVEEILGSRTGQTVVREVVRGVFGTLSGGRKR